ncbi:MAG: MBL fold metallo-hydrolase [Myxococcales bacterium]|nr:MBL fold metallo-hydrolase [Myxococcales bacterium]
MTTLRFLGAAGTVTGSKFLVDTGRQRLLIDDGMFQGEKSLRLKNWEPFPEAPSSIDQVLLTHAHLDHTGMLPRLIRNGFDGPIHATPGTVELLHILWPDAAKLQEEDAGYANRKGFTKHKPALPLFNMADVEHALTRLKRQRYDKELLVAPGITAKWLPTGHIVGAAMILLTIERSDGPLRILFSGDVGPYNVPVMNDPSNAPEADVMLLESTYGDRDHADVDLPNILLELVKPVLQRGGRVLIPAFAVGRAQIILYLLNQLIRRGDLPRVPVVIDSPMAVKATDVLRDHSEEYDDELQGWIAKHGCPFDTEMARLIEKAEESKAFCVSRGPAIVVSASGMATGGRVLHYLRQLLPDEKNLILFSGYQADGTRGRRILNGEKSVKIHGHDVACRAKVDKIPGLSAHGDRGHLTRYLASMPNKPKRLFLIHGEPDARIALREHLSHELGIVAELPELGQTVEI